MTYILGVDPGKSGAIALLNYKTLELKTYRVPLLKIKKGKKTYTELDEATISDMIHKLSDEIDLAVIEKVHSMPNQGVASTFSFGVSYGVIRGIISANFIKTKHATPQEWKGDLNVPANKDLARARASELFPLYSGQWQKKCEDGCAEAAMIAYYGYLKWDRIV